MQTTQQCGHTMHCWCCTAAKMMGEPCLAPVPTFSKEMDSDWQQKKQTSEGLASQLPGCFRGSSIPSSLHAKVLLVMLMLALRSGISCQERTMAAGLYCQVSRVTFTLPVWLHPKHFQEGCEWGGWTRHRKYVALSKKCAWDEGDTAREWMCKEPSTTGEVTSWGIKEKKETKVERGNETDRIWVGHNPIGKTSHCFAVSFAGCRFMVFSFLLIYVFLLLFLPRSLSVCVNLMARPLLPNSEILSGIWNLKIQLSRHKESYFLLPHLNKNDASF